MPGIILSSLLTCPHCGHAASMAMPEDACVWFFDCPGCGRVLEPAPGDCCVFCSHGSLLRAGDDGTVIIRASFAVRSPHAS